MRLTAASLPAVENINELALMRLLERQSFGNIVTLEKSEDDVVQCVFNGSRTEECWSLAYLDGPESELLQTARGMTLEDAKAAMIAYLNGDESWQKAYSWIDEATERLQRELMPITEADWKSCNVSTDLLSHLRKAATDQDFQRLNVAFCRRIWPLLVDERSRNSVVSAELELAGSLSADERLVVAQAAADALVCAGNALDKQEQGNGHLFHAAWAAALCMPMPGLELPLPHAWASSGEAYERAIQIAVNAAYAAGIAAIRQIESKPEMHQRLNQETSAEYAAQCEIIRESFAFPFIRAK